MHGNSASVQSICVYDVFTAFVYWLCHLKQAECDGVCDAARTLQQILAGKVQFVLY